MRLSILGIRVSIALATGTVLVIAAAAGLYLAGETTPKSSISMDRAREIRKFAAREIDHAVDEEVLLDYRELHDQPASFGLELSRQDAGGYWCGGAAIITRQLFEENGARSWIYNYGLKGILTHVTTLVEVGGKIYIQDSYFNFEYVQDDGTPMPFSQVLSSLEEGISPKIVTETDYERDWHFSGTKPVGNSLVGGQYRIKGNQIIYRAPLTLESIHKSGFSKPALDWLEKQGYPRDLAFFMLFPLDVSGHDFTGNYCLSSTCPQILVDLSEKVPPNRRHAPSLGTRLRSFRSLAAGWLP